MKKYIFTVVALFLGVCQMSAQKIVFDEVVEVPLDGKAQVAVKYETGGLRITTYSLNFDLSEAEGLSIAQKDGGIDFVTDSKNSGFNVYPTATGIGATAKNTSVSLDGTTGTLGTVTFEATAPLKVNDEVTVKVNKLSLVEYTDDERLVTMELKDLSFTVKIIENRVTFDEQATELPSATGLQNVLVKRTIKANQWNTICLPFAMTAEQVAKAFGEAQLADFTGCTADYPEGAEYATSIKVNFQSVTEMAANRPYLIKVANPVTYADGFKVDNVNVAPEEELVNAQDEVKTKISGKTYYFYNSFLGTYVANTEIPAGSIILSGNKFYYTKGTTTKGFRGWFSFDNCSLNDIDLATAEVKIFVDDVTAIDGIGFQRIAEGVYDLSGRKIQLENGDLNKLQKGVYIIDGKKVTIK